MILHLKIVIRLHAANTEKFGKFPQNLQRYYYNRKTAEIDFIAGLPYSVKKKLLRHFYENPVVIFFREGKKTFTIRNILFFTIIYKRNHISDIPVFRHTSTRYL